MLDSVAHLVGVQMVVEDPDGAVTDLAIYNYPNTGPGTSSALVNQLFPVGTTMAVREPMLKLGSQDGRPLIRVDSISDIVFLHQNDPICSKVKWTFPLTSTSPSLSVEELKRVGNGHFLRNKWLLAVFAYSKGLRLDKEAYLLRLNRAEAYLRLSYYSAALLDARAVLSNQLIDSKSRWKALSRAAKALYFQENYTAAKEMFLESMKFSEDEDSKDWLQRIEKREEELCHGKFDWTKIYVESLKSERIQHIADFRGPIEVTTLADRGGGRGILATADIEVGQLLLVEKPFVSVFPKDIPGGHGLLSYNLLTNTVDGTCHTVLISQVMERLWGNPDQYDVVHNLYAGPEYSSKAPSLSTLNTEISFPFKSVVDIDTEHLEAIVSYNSFSPLPLTSAEARKKDKPSQLEDSAALYLLSSLFSHSCAANAVWTSVGDLMVIRAVESIKKGEEIFIPYINGTTPLKERQKALKKHFSSECPCELCTADRLDGIDNCERRADLIDRLHASHSVKDCRRLLQQIEATYKTSRGILRPEMFYAKHRMAEVLRFDLNASHSRLSETALQSRLKEVIALDIDALKSIGISFKDQKPIPDQLPSTVDIVTLVSDYLAIAVNFLNMDDHARAEAWVKAADSALQSGLGGDKTLFKLLFGNVVDKMGIRDFVYSII
ncbi:hypothetical protein VKT23_003518 [Stygiomarasmius scandens]|uniref:SET domain-containing protein n=1 Tax=Marasmiellus scandens TaxID=2682957 RepID=A0ABR1K371_9AGAR